MVKTTSTLHIKTFTSYNRESKELFVYTLNKLDSDESVSLEIKGSKVTRVVQRWELVGNGPEDTDPEYRQVECIRAKILI